jgi:26S proteasome regulatory subunit N5
VEGDERFGLDRGHGLSQKGDLAGALESLLALEKKTRQASDAFAGSRVAQAVIKACWAAKDLEALMEQVATLCKKRGQSKRATVTIVRQSMRYVDALSQGWELPVGFSRAPSSSSSGAGESESKEADDSAAAPVDPKAARAAKETAQEHLEDKGAYDNEKEAQTTDDATREEGSAVAAAGGKSLRDARLALVHSLREVTVGKMWVEVERARLTRALAELHEKEGRLSEACSTLQEAAVETIATMLTGEKLDFLLEQTRLCLETKDYIRMGIIANKVQRRVIDRLEHEERKLRYFEMLSELHEHRLEAQELAKDYRAILECTRVQEDESLWKNALGSVILYSAISPWSETLEAEWHALLRDKRIESLPSHQALLTDLTTPEVSAFPRPELSDLATTRVFVGLEAAKAAWGSSRAISELSGSDQRGERWWGMLHRRVVQHNLRVMSKLFSRLRFERLCELLVLDPAVCEAELRDMVTAKDLYARIDRPAGVVKFRKQRPAAQVLTEWGADLAKVLSLVDRTTHLIQKERMVHAAKLST